MCEQYHICYECGETIYSDLEWHLDAVMCIYCESAKRDAKVRSLRRTALISVVAALLVGFAAGWLLLV